MLQMSCYLRSVLDVWISILCQYCIMKLSLISPKAKYLGDCFQFLCHILKHGDHFWVISMSACLSVCPSHQSLSLDTLTGILYSDFTVFVLSLIECHCPLLQQTVQVHECYIIFVLMISVYFPQFYLLKVNYKDKTWKHLFFPYWKYHWKHENAVSRIQWIDCNYFDVIWHHRLPWPTY